MLKINLKKLKAYGDRLGDGVVQMSFTLPISLSPEAKEAAKRLVEAHGFKRVSIAVMEAMGHGFSYFVAYAHSEESIDFSKIRIPKIEVPQMDYKTLKEYMAKHLERPIVVIGATTGSDAHTVGIDAIMNMKGYAGDYGLERYPLFRAINLRSQLTNQQLLDKATELSADVILISQVVTQRDSHLKNLKEFRELIAKDKRIGKEIVVIVGGPRIDYAHALKLGFDAGFGVGTKPSQVASFIVHEYMKRHGIKEKREETVPAAEDKHTLHPLSPERHIPTRGTHLPSSVPIAGESLATDNMPPLPQEKKQEGEIIETGAIKKKRRRGRRGGRRHRQRQERQRTTTIDHSRFSKGSS